MYKLMNNFDRAMYYTQKALDINANHIDSLILMKEIYLIQNDLHLAKEICDKIYEIQPMPENLA